MDPFTEIFKFILHTCSIFLALSGIGLLTYGFILFGIEQQYIQIYDHTYCVETWTIILGFVLLPVSCLGCYGNYKEKKCLLFVYAVLLLLVFVFQVSLGIFTAITLHPKEGVNEIIKENFEKNFRKNDTEFLSVLNRLQKKFRCCGVHGPKDYQIVPESCCGERNIDGVCDKVFEIGCAASYANALIPAHRAVGYISLVFSVPEPIGSWLALIIRKRLSRQPSPPPEAPTA